jgi:hypothetical protein
MKGLMKGRREVGSEEVCRRYSMTANMVGRTCSTEKKF